MRLGSRRSLTWRKSFQALTWPQATDASIGQRKRGDHRPLLLSTEFQNLVLQKLWVQVDILSAYEDFSEQLQELIGQIEAEVVPQ